MILDAARFAPSVHNTQPWRVQVIDQGLRITVDDRYVLGDGDPTGRELAISLGIFTEALLGSCKAYGLAPNVVNQSGDVVTISFDKQIKPNPNKDVLRLLKNRVTDRSIYKPAHIPAGLQKSLSSLASDKNTDVTVVEDAETLTKIADLTARGIRLALGSPNFRQELSHYLVLPKSSKKRGISVKSLHIPSIIAIMEPLILRLGLALGKEAALEKKRWLSASAVIIITSAGDVQSYWFNVGRTYLKVSLELERLGLSQATSAALVEASTFHEDIESDLKTTQRIQSVLRVGKGSKNKNYSPRISAEDILIT